MASTTRNTDRSKEKQIPEEREKEALVLYQRYRRTGEVPQASRWSGTGVESMVQAKFKRLRHFSACQDGLKIVDGEGSVSPAVGGVVWSDKV